MLTLLITLTIISSIIGGTHSVPKPDEKHTRAHDSISHASHLQNEEHNPQYDHEAFLGEDQAKTFDQLTPEESKRRLG
jgi:calumenin